MIFGRIKKFLAQGRKPPKPKAVKVQKSWEMATTFDETMMAISFAEAGAHQEALEIFRQQKNRKILVLSLGEGFSEAMMGYVILLAERLGYEVLALNVGPAAWEKPLSPATLKQQEEFREHAQAAAAKLASIAFRKKIPIRHEVKFADPAKAVGEITRQYRRIELVITDSRQIEEELPAWLSLPVFGLKTF